MNFLLAVLSGLLLVLVFPKANLTMLAPAALAPLLYACARETRWKRRFLLGWLAGVVYWFGVCNWIQFVLAVHGGMGEWGGWGVFLLFSLAKALHMGAFAALAGLLLPARWAIPAVAALWVAIERTHAPLGF
ncbi:MAG: apolipoprotein N-acyltransferase, partial [Acidobacteria bacterium]|nr:apolipoprotein N-acyltransferase [Acidobacteriota bacterium]